jgi:hypothetical protein
LEETCCLQGRIGDKGKYEDEGSMFLENIVTHPQTTCCHTPKEHKLIIYTSQKYLYEACP